VAPRQEPPAASDREALFWQSVKDSRNPADFRSYLDQYSTGTFASLARNRLAEIEASQQAALPPQPPADIAVTEMDEAYRVRSTANLRSGPSTADGRIATLSPGRLVTVTGKVDGKDWYRVALDDGTTGYVFGDLIEPETGRAQIPVQSATLPSNPPAEQPVQSPATGRGAIGTRVGEVTPAMAEVAGLGAARGASIVELTAGGPAETAGLEVGDIIIELAGTAVTDMQSLRDIAASLAVGRQTDIVVWRDRQTMPFLIVIGDRETLLPAAAPAAPTDAAPEPEPIMEGRWIESLGANLAKLSPALRAQHALDANANGALVLVVSPPGRAARSGLQSDDLIVAVDDLPIYDPADVDAYIAEAVLDGDDSVTVQIERYGSQYTLEVALD
jgi:S1-C subfamily serine protease